MRSLSMISIAFAAAVTMLGAREPVHALTLHQGHSVILNADFTGANPPPPYFGAAILQFLFSGGDPGERFKADVFGGLNAAGTLVGTLENLSVGPGGNITSFAPDLLDGVFSIRLTAVIGDFNLDDAWFEARNSPFGGPPEVTIPVAFSSVPEPTALALVGTVGVLAALRRRRAA